MYPYGYLEIPLAPKSHDTLVELFRFTIYVEKNKVDKQQKRGEHVENIQFSLDTQLNCMFSTCSTVFWPNVLSPIHIHDNHIQV